MPNIHSIKFRIIAFGILLTVVGLALRMLLGVPLVRDQIADLVSAQETLMANYVAQDIDPQHSIAPGIDRQAGGGSGAFRCWSNRIALAAWLQDRQRINPLFSGLLVIKPDGHRLLASWPALLGQAQLDYADIEWFRAALKSDRAVIGTPTQWPPERHAADVYGTAGAQQRRTNGRRAGRIFSARRTRLSR